MHEILEGILGFFLTPLVFLPSSVLLFLEFATGVFKVLLIGKLLRWLWDILPVV